MDVVNRNGERFREGFFLTLIYDDELGRRMRLGKKGLNRDRRFLRTVLGRNDEEILASCLRQPRSSQTLSETRHDLEMVNRAYNARSPAKDSCDNRKDGKFLDV